MPAMPLHITPRPSAAENPLPQLLHTPSGLALLELQGTFHFPAPTSASQTTTQLGKLVFPLYNPALNDPSDTKWMKRVYMYVGKGQRMTGECKKLGKPLGLIRKREQGEGVRAAGEDVDMDEDGVRGAREEELEIVEVVRYKLVFSSRPEPISGVVDIG